MSDKTFDLIVEGHSDDPKTVAPPALELKNLRWDGDAPPDVVTLEGGTILVKVGRYLSPGDRYHYRIADCAKLVGGQLIFTQ
jgi:hypothetical protein